MALSKLQSYRLAVVAHDGLALSIRPVHTSYDGDTVFAVSTGPGSPHGGTEDTLALETAAVEVLARAVRDAVRPG